MNRRNAIRTACGAALAAVAAFPATVAVAAVGDHVWSTGYPAAGEVAMDGSGHVVTHGTFFGTIDLGGGPLTAVNFAGGDQYLARFDAQGSHVWSRSFTPVGLGASGTIIAADPAGNIYIAGALFAGATIDYGGGVIAGPQVYVAKFDPSGNHLWSGGFGNGSVKDLETNGSQVVITGHTTVGVNFGGGVLGGFGLRDIYVAQLSAGGIHVWSSGFGNATEQSGLRAAIDKGGNVLLVGSMAGAVDFGGGALIANGIDLFLAKFNSTGAHQWSQVFDGVFTPGGGVQLSVDVSTGPSEEVALAGEIVGSVDFGGGAMTAAGFSDMFVAMFDGTGAHEWSAVYGSAGAADYAGGVAVGSNGSVVTSGVFGADADFGGGLVAHGSGSLNSNVFAAVYDSTGAHEFSAGYGPDAYLARCRMDSSDRVLIYGGANDVDLGGGPLSPADLFVAKLDGTSGGGATGVESSPAYEGRELRAFPNPFAAVTRIEYVVRTSETVSVSVFDVRGRLVKKVVDRRRQPGGTHTVDFSARTPGVYFVKLETDGVSRSIRTVAVR